MITDAHVLDFALADPAALEASRPVFRALFAVEEVVVPPELEVTGSTFAHHFAVPPFLGIGFFCPRDPARRYFPPMGRPHEYFPWLMQQRLARRGEGAYYIGFLMESLDDLERTFDELRQRGVRFLVDELARPDPLGQKVSVDPNTLYGVGLYYGFYDNSVLASWQPEAGPRPRTIHDATPSVRSVHCLDVAVEEVAAAEPIFAQHLRTKGTRIHHELDPTGEHLDCVSFELPFFSFGVVALKDPTRRYDPPHVDRGQLAPWLVQQHLEARGEGLFHLGLAVGDVQADVEATWAAGVPFLFPEPLATPVSRVNIADPSVTSGIVVALSEHDPDRYRDWRATARV